MPAVILKQGALSYKNRHISNEDSCWARRFLGTSSGDCAFVGRIAAPKMSRLLIFTEPLEVADMRKMVYGLYTPGRLCGKSTWCPWK